LPLMPRLVNDDEPHNIMEADDYKNVGRFS
jgi:hypothetical protein